jgi:SEC-C motif-containing protein
MPLRLCYCNSKKEFSECCEPFLINKQKPSTPVQLMRSRYSAFVLGDGEYLVKTTTKENRYEDDIEIIKEFAKSALWLGLEVLGESESQVEFKAFYKEGNIINVLHEKSSFVREDGMWLYKDGILFNSKIERNEPCPCKSGKKYKKCCG